MCYAAGKPQILNMSAVKHMAPLTFQLKYLYLFELNIAIVLLNLLLTRDMRLLDMEYIFPTKIVRPWVYVTTWLDLLFVGP